MEVSIWASQLVAGCDQMCLLFNPIQGLFAHQYLWKSSVDYLLGDIHQEKVISKTIIFGWIWPGMFHVQSDCRILSLTIALEEICWYLRYFCLRIIIMWKWHLRLLLLIGCVQVYLFFNQITVFFYH